jgi:hypothetical protein
MIEQLAEALRTTPPGRVVCIPMKSFPPSARPWTISAAVCPCAAQCILFCTIAKNCCRPDVPPSIRSNAASRPTGIASESRTTPLPVT